MERLPQSLDAEQAVLGAILKDKEAIVEVAEILDDESHFYEPKNQFVYRAALDLHLNNKPIDITTVANELNRFNKLKRCGGRVYLVDLVEGVASTANLLTHANIVFETSLLRRLILLCGEAQKSAYARERGANEIISDLSGALLRVSSTKSGGFQRIGEVLPRLLEHLSDVSEGKKRFGLPTGFPAVDELTGGHARGDLIIYAGRPGMGKTALMGCEAQFLCSKGAKVGIVSAESDAAALTLRLLSGASRIDSHRLRLGRLATTDWDRIADVQARLGEWELDIDDTASIDIDTLITRASALKQRQGLDILYVDHLQCLTIKKSLMRREATTIITQRLKDFAKIMQIPVVCLCQLSRKIEERANKRPMPSDAKETGDIEQICDIFVGLYRPEIYETGEDKGKSEGIAEYIVGKNRNGPTGSVPLHYDKEYTRFIDVVDHQVEKYQGEIPF